MELKVFNVGQGNLNVFETAEAIVFYDFGCCKIKSKKDASELFGKLEQYFKKNIDVYIIISHWDIDHYILLKLLIEFLNLVNSHSLKYVIGPYQLPNCTSKKIVKSLEDLKVSIKLIKSPTVHPSMKLRGYNFYTKYNLSLNKHKIFGENCVQFELYHGTKKADRNRYSLVLKIKVCNSYLIILTGDSFYKDVNNYVLNSSDFRNIKKIYYLIPHHGGNAGKFELSKLDTVEKTLINNILSVGTNNYGHPNKQIMQNFDNIFRTDVSDDFSVNFIELCNLDYIEKL